MLKIYILGFGCIYDASIAYTNQLIQKPKLDLKANTAGSLTFTIAEGMDGYTYLNIFKSILYVSLEYKNVENVIWAGRVYEEKRDELNNRVIECEGALAFLNDSIQPNTMEVNILFKSVFYKAIMFHNSLMTNASLRFDVSHFSPTGSYDGYFSKIIDAYETTDPSVVLKRSNDTTLDFIMDEFVKKYGGYLKITHKLSSDGKTLINKLDYIDAYDIGVNPVVSQPIKFGENLVSLERTATADDFATVIYPIGDSLDDSDKSWTMYEHIGSGKCRFYNQSPTNTSQVNYQFGYRIDSETGYFTRTTDQNFAILQFIPCEPGDRFFLTTYLRGVALSESSDGKTFLGAASYCIHKSDRATAVTIGTVAKNIKSNDVEVTKEVLLELSEIKIPEEGAYLSIGFYNPNGNGHPFELRKFNPYYAETNYSIMEAPVHSPTDSSPYAKTKSFKYLRDTYPSETWEKSQLLGGPKYEDYFESRIVKHRDLVAEFGFICKTVIIEGASHYNANTLYMYGQATEILKRMTEKIELKIKAVDLSFLDDNDYAPFYLLDMVHALSDPHNLDTNLPILELSIPLDAPENAEYTMMNEVETRDGEPSYMSVYMSDMYKKGSA